MMIAEGGNIFRFPADVRVNPVNCHGVMGAGLAKQFKERYVGLFPAYRRACRSGALRPGMVHRWWSEEWGEWVINFPTKDHWRDPSQYSDIETGLVDLRIMLAGMGKVTVCVPALGCGLGGLKWDWVKGRIMKHLNDLPEVNIILFPTKVTT